MYGKQTLIYVSSFNNIYVDILKTDEFWVILNSAKNFYIHNMVKKHCEEKENNQWKRLAGIWINITHVQYYCDESLTLLKNYVEFPRTHHRMTYRNDIKLIYTQ